MATQFTGPVTVAAHGLYEGSTTQLHQLGDVAFTNDGRSFRYARCGSTTALVSGNMLQAYGQDTGTQNLTAVAAAVGDTSLVSTSTTTVYANEYAGGIAIISVTPGIGKVYKIKSHAAFTAAAPTLTLEDPIKVALTTDSRIDLVRNPFSVVVVNPTAALSSPVGVAVDALAVNAYGWIQVGGVAGVLADGALVVGEPVVSSNGTAGAVEDASALAGTQQSVGIAHTGVATGEVGAVKLQGLL